MLSEGTRSFDLYDFFSVLIPGFVLIIGFIPFFPQRIPLTSTAVVLILAVLGLVIGRGIHAIGIKVESYRNIINHRQKFAKEVADPNCLSDNLVESFYNRCSDTFEELDLPDRSSIDEASEELTALYPLVRSYIHMDSRGRSRTFQAVLDFYRGISIVSGILVSAYAIYAVFLYMGVTTDLLRYDPYITEVEIDSVLIFWGSIAVLGGAYVVYLRGTREKYRELFVEYLISDFMILTGGVDE